MSSSPDYLLNQAIEAINSGNKQSGRWLLTDLLNDDPYNEEAWMWMALAVDTEEERLQCLEQVLALNPYNEDARRELAVLQSDPGLWYQQPPAEPYPEPEPEPEAAAPASRFCSHCGESVGIEDQFCRFCGGPLQEEDALPSDAAPLDRPRFSRKKSWYFSTPVLILTFFLVTPLWSILVLADEQQSGLAKTFAILILLIYVLLLFAASLYYGALTAA